MRPVRRFPFLMLMIRLGRIDIQIVCWRELRECLSKALLRRESLEGLLSQKERG